MCQRSARQKGRFGRSLKAVRPDPCRLLSSHAPFGLYFFRRLVVVRLVPSI